MDFLYLLESIRNPVLDAIFSVITHLGEEMVFIVVAMILLWCVDKYEAYFMLFTGFIGTQINQLLKVTFRIERPWVKDPNFHAVESAIPEATGYSFPSGHTQSATGTFGAIGLWNRKTWLRIVCAALIVLVAFSRMYLGVHTPLDVGVSLLVAVVLLAVLYPVMKKLRDNPKGMRILLAILVAISVAQTVYMTVTLYHETAAELLSGLKNAYKMLGAVAGMAVVYELDQRFIRYETNAVWWAQILKVALGLGLTLGVKELCYAAFSFIEWEPLSRVFSYFFMVLFAGAVWPLTFRWFAKLGRK